MWQDVIWHNESAPGISETIQTDAKIWHFLDEKCFDGIQVVNGKTPLEEALTDVLKSYKIDSLLAPRPRGSTKATDPPKETAPIATAAENKLAPTLSPQPTA